MILVLLIALVLVPWVISEAGGVSAVTAGLAGVSGKFGNLFDPRVAYALGIPMTFGLLAGPICDQMFFQRAMAVDKRNIVRTFVLGGCIFGVIPIVLSLFGFVAANPQVAPMLDLADDQLVGAVVIGYFLPKAALLLFALMAFAGLASTLDSAYCAVSSLGAIDVYRRYLNPWPLPEELLSAARTTMIAVALLGTGLALLQPKLLWVFLIYGATASAGMFPTIFSVFSKKLTDKGAFYAVLLSLGIGTPLAVYANLTESVHLVVLSAVASVAIGFVVCLSSALMNKGEEFSIEEILKMQSQ
jgi:SSS family solute:Na+ symporter